MKMNANIPIVLAALLLVGAVFYWRRGAVGVSDTPQEAEWLEWSIIDDAQDAVGGFVAQAASFVGVETWRAPAAYAPAIRAAESRYGIPSGMLERLLYQESHYREDIITGAKKSRVGALGIAQFMPATAKEVGVNPLDPIASIDGAGRYLKRMYGSTGDWGLALAAYNWGLGNVQRKGIQNAPSETRNYYSSILAAVGGAGSALA
jgi:soluble lytic murein transglycosylase-like protein